MRVKDKPEWVPPQGQLKPEGQTFPSISILMDNSGTAQREEELQHEHVQASGATWSNAALDSASECLLLVTAWGRAA